MKLKNRQADNWEFARAVAKPVGDSGEYHSTHVFNPRKCGAEMQRDGWPQARRCFPLF